MRKLYFIRYVMSFSILLLCLIGKAELIQNSQKNTFVEISDSNVFSLLTIPKSIGNLRLIDFSGIESGNYLFTTQDLDPNDGENNVQVAFNNNLQLDTTLSNINYFGFIKHKNFVIYPVKKRDSNIQILSNTLTKESIVIPSGVFTKDILTIDCNTVVVFSSRGRGVVKTLFGGDNYFIDSFSFNIIRNEKNIFRNEKNFSVEDNYRGCFMGNGYFGFVIDSTAETKIIYTYVFNDQKIFRASVKAKSIYTNKSENILITTDNGVFKKLCFNIQTGAFIEQTLPAIKNINKLKIASFDYYKDVLFILAQREIIVKRHKFNVSVLYKVSSSVKEIDLYTSPNFCSKFNKIFIENNILYLIGTHNSTTCNEIIYGSDEKRFPCWESLWSENRNSFIILKVSLIPNNQKSEMNPLTICFEKVSKIMENNFIPLRSGKSFQLYVTYYNTHKYCPEIYVIKIGELTYYFDPEKKLVWNEFKLRKKIKDKDINSAIKFCVNNFKSHCTYLNLYGNL